MSISASSDIITTSTTNALCHQPVSPASVGRRVREVVAENVNCGLAYIRASVWRHLEDLNEWLTSWSVEGLATLVAQGPGPVRTTALAAT